MDLISPDLAGMLAPAAPESKDWRDRALCAQTDPEIFFPDKGESTAAAKRVCRACDVRAECLQDALDHHERFGVWGGLSERERRQLLCQRGHGAAADLDETAETRRDAA